MTILSALEHYLARPARRMMLPVAAAAVFGYAPLSNAMDMSPLEREVDTIRREMDPLRYSPIADYNAILTASKRQMILNTYDKCVRNKDFATAREVADYVLRPLTINKGLTENDKQGFLPLVSSLYVKLGMRPFGPERPINNAALEQKIRGQINAAIVNCTRATYCQNRAEITGNLLEGLAQTAALYDNNPSLAYILLTYGGYRGAKQSNDTRALLASAQRGCTKDYDAAILLVRSLPQFRSASLAGQHPAVIKTADAILAAFDDKKFPSWPFTDLREEARLRKMYALHCQKNDKDALAVAESCQLEFPGWDLEPVGQGNDSKSTAYRTAEQAFQTNPLRLSAWAGMIDASEGADCDRRIALLNAIQPDGVLAQQYKAGKPDAGTTISGALDKKDPPAVTKPQQPDEKE